ncbi:MAG: hypothetical protein WC628_10100 [Candidatus Omnitrophota bacterium]
MEKWLGEETLKDSQLRDLVWATNKIGQIPIEDMGIYGSILVGLNKEESDTDMLIYGIENLKKLKDKFDLILKNAKAKKATDEQRCFRTKIWMKHCPLSKEMIFKMEKRRWSGIGIHGEKPMAIRFAYKEHEIPSNLITTLPLKTIKSKGKVLDSFGTHFLPRTAKVKTNGRVLDVISYYWLFFSCVCDGDDVEIHGAYRKDRQREYITLDEPTHYISPI